MLPVQGGSVLLADVVQVHPGLLAAAAGAGRHGHKRQRTSGCCGSGAMRVANGPRRLPVGFGMTWRCAGGAPWEGGVSWDTLGILLGYYVQAEAGRQCSVSLTHL